MEAYPGASANLQNGCFPEIPGLLSRDCHPGAAPRWATRVSESVMNAAESGVDFGSLERLFRDGMPHGRELGIEVVAVEPASGTLKLAYQDRLVGNPETGVLHGGVITTLIDSVCGIAVFAALSKFAPIATLDLRIDYLKPATPGKDLFARADCYKVTRNVAFVRATAYHDDVDDPIANSAGTFMIGVERGPRNAAGGTP